MGSRQQIEEQIRYLQDKLRKQSARAVPSLPESLRTRPKRHIALLVSYDGWAHSGLAWQPPSSHVPLPTVEACLLEALEQARLIEPGVRKDGFGCGFERCGRTDAGVSSSGQVVNLWVRSDVEDPMRTGDRWRSHARPSPVEIPYVQAITRFLPPSIRVLAWSPVASAFSSRYSCIWRHYKYFFTGSLLSSLRGRSFDFGAAYTQEDLSRLLDQIELSRTPGLTLDIAAMRSAVEKLVGEHDFRNMCKVDAAKQLPMHVRSVFTATIDPVEGDNEMYCLNMRGAAFLYNQVRSIVALLLLIGTKLESPKLIEDLLWTSDRTETTIRMHGTNEHAEIIDRKPGYEMAADIPLVLWQCGFNASDLDWRIDNTPRVGDPNYQVWRDLLSKETAAGHDSTGIPPRRAFVQALTSMNRTLEQAKLKAIVEQHHVGSFARVALRAIDSADGSEFESDSKDRHLDAVMVPHGAGDYTLTRHYAPLLTRPRQETPDELNRRWAEGRGKWRMDLREQNREESDKQREINLRIKREAMLKAQREGT